MKRCITWFIIGFVVSWLTWQVVAYIRFRPKDYTALWSAPQQEHAPKWIKKANGRRLGHFMVFTPADSEIAAAYIHPTLPSQYPGVFIQDQDADGRLDSIVVADSTYQCVALLDDSSDGVFDSFGYSTAIGKDSVCFTDCNMDGQYDMRIGPGQVIAVTIGTQWHDLINTNKKQYVEIGEGLTPVKAIDGTWQVIEE